MGFGADGGTICNTGQVAVTGTIATLLAANTTQSRVSITISNTSTVASPISLYVGPSGITTSTGHYIPPASSWTTTFRGTIYAIGSGSMTATYFEEVNA